MNQLEQRNSPARMLSVEGNTHSKLRNLKSNRVIPVRHGFPHLGHPSQRYSLNWVIEQAGKGWLSLGNYYGFSTVLIKKSNIDSLHTDFPKLRMAFHENLVGLVEAFLDGSSVYLAYNYYGFAVSFAQVVSTPAVELSDPDFASVCRSVLRGLQYIHEQLQVGHGKIDSSNVLLCYDGTVKIANIGDAMLKWTQASFQMDRECLGSLLLHLSRTQRATSLTQGEARDRTSRSGLSNYAMHFVEHIGPASYSFLFEHVFLQQANPDGRTWYLIPHYLDTIMYWGVLPQQAENEVI